MDVYIFKTSVKRKDFKNLKPVLDKILLTGKWKFDFADCDKILRVESNSNISTNVCNSLSALGYMCIELE